MRQRRRLLAAIGLTLDALVCGFWAYWAASQVLQSLSASGSGGIAGVSVSSGLVESLTTVAPPIITILLARASGSAFARYWRNAHFAALLALIILPMLGGLRLIMVSIVVLLPVQMFFVVGALMLWFDRPRPSGIRTES
jgi:hypothetical protein